MALPSCAAGCIDWKPGGLPTDHGPCQRLGSIPREKGPSEAWEVASAFPVWCTVPTIYAPKCFIVHNLKSVPTEWTLRPPPASGHLCSTLGLCVCLMRGVLVPFNQYRDEHIKRTPKSGWFSHFKGITAHPVSEPIRSHCCPSSHRQVRPQDMRVRPPLLSLQPSHHCSPDLSPPWSQGSLCSSPIDQTLPPGISHTRYPGSQGRAVLLLPWAPAFLNATQPSRSLARTSLKSKATSGGLSRNLSLPNTSL